MSYKRPLPVHTPHENKSINKHTLPVNTPVESKPISKRPKPVKTVEEFYEALKQVSNNSVKLSGIYPGYFGNYAFILNLNE